MRPGDVVIAGVGETAVGVVPGVTSTQMHTEALLIALADAGMELDQVDGLITMGSMVEKWSRHAMVLAEGWGILQNLNIAHQVSLGGASTIVAIKLAAQLVDSGNCRTVAIVGADPQLSGLSRDLAIELMASFRHGEFEAPFGPLNPSCFGLLAQRHMYEHGTTAEQLAEVAVTQRAHAILTGRGHMTKPITVDDVLGSKMISSPLHMLDCSLVSDGGGAVIISRRTAQTRDDAVSITGLGEGYARQDHISEIVTMEPADLGAERSGKQAFEMAGLSHADIDVAMLYDCFTITPILLLESLGFCKLGEGGRYVQDQGIGLSSSMPVNTHGGLLSYGHSGYPSIMFGLVEAVRQLRGECGARQVPDARHA